MKIPGPRFCPVNTSPVQNISVFETFRSTCNVVGIMKRCSTVEETEWPDNGSARTPNASLIEGDGSCVAATIRLRKLWTEINIICDRIKITENRQKYERFVAKNKMENRHWIRISTNRSSIMAERNEPNELGRCAIEKWSTKTWQGSAEVF